MTNGLKLDPVAIPIADAARSQQFDAHVLGLPLVSAMSGADGAGHAWLLMFYELADARRLALTTFRGVLAASQSVLPADARHYALTTADLEGWRWRLSQHGARCARRITVHSIRCSSVVFRRSRRYGLGDHQSRKLGRSGARQRRRTAGGRSLAGRRSVTVATGTAGGRCRMYPRRRNRERCRDST